MPITRMLPKLLPRPFARGKTRIEQLERKVAVLEQANARLRERLVEARARRNTMAERIVRLKGRLAKAREWASTPMAGDLGPRTDRLPTPISSKPVVQAKYRHLLPARHQHGHD
jgi:uncharacterized coiled-coil protein SlyX